MHARVTIDFTSNYHIASDVRQGRGSYMIDLSLPHSSSGLGVTPLIPVTFWVYSIPMIFERSLQFFWDIGINNHVTVHCNIFHTFINEHFKKNVGHQIIKTTICHERQKTQIVSSLQLSDLSYSDACILRRDWLFQNLYYITWTWTNFLLKMWSYAKALPWRENGIFYWISIKIMHSREFEPANTMRAHVINYTA